MSADFAFLNIFTADGLLDDNDMSPKVFDLRVKELAYEDAIILNSDAWYRYIGTDINEYLIMSNDPMCKTDEVKSIGRNLALNGEKDYTPEEMALLWTIDPNGVKYYMDRYRDLEFKRRAYRVINDVEASDDEVNDFFKVYTDGEAARAYLKKSWNQLVYGKFNKQENNTTLGTLAEIGAGFTGVDIAQDSRDLVYDIKSRLDGDKENDVSTGEIIFDAVCVLPLIGVIKHYDEIIAIFRGSDKIIAIKRLAKLDDLKNLSRLTGAADVARSAKKKLNTVDAGFYNKVLNACEQSDAYRKKFAVKGIYDNEVLDLLFDPKTGLVDLAEKDLESFNVVVKDAAERLCNNENISAEAIKEMVERSVKKLENVLDDSGKFVDDKLEQKYQAYAKRKVKAGKTPRDRLDWKKASDYWTKQSPVARGNNFNHTVRDAELYPFNEIYLANGFRLDSYDPIKGEIISRKATDLDKIAESTFRDYLSEFEKKYYKGSRIRSNMYQEIDGLELEGNYILEIPASNELLDDIDDYKRIAAEYDVTLRFTEEFR